MPKKTPSERDKIISMTAKVNVNTGEIVFKDQSEIETLALEMLGTAENIFFEKDPDSSLRPAEIPIGDNVILEYDAKYSRGWVLHTLNSDCI
jgi:hypothetical protein